MKNLKQPVKYITIIILTLLIGLLDSSCFAMLDQSGFFITAEGALTHQIDESTAYTLLDLADPTEAPDGKLKKNDPGHQLSGGGSVGYLFDNHFDISFSFFINDHTSSSSASATEAGVNHLDPTLAPPSWVRNAAETATNQYDYRTNDFNLIFGQWLDLNEDIHLHPYLGLSILSVKSRQKTNYFDLNDLPEDANIIERSSVKAIGPLAGAGISWNFYKAISLEGDLGVILSTGHIHSSYTATNNIGDTNPIFSDTQITSKTNRQIFETLDAQIGLGYHPNTAKNVATELIMGYKFLKHFDSKSEHAIPYIFSTGLSQHFFIDSGFSGPFLSFTLQFI